jgi:phage gpG-like protein
MSRFPLYPMTGIRNLGERFLIQSARVSRPQHVKTPDGGWEDSLKVVLEAAPCRVILPTRDPARAVRGEQANEAQMFGIAFALGSDVQANDVVEVDSLVFDVLSVETEGLQFITGCRRCGGRICMIKPFEVRIVVNRLPAIQTALGQQVQGEITHTALRIRARAVAAMHEPKHGRVYQRFNMGKPHQASAAGEAPAVDTGALAQSLNVQPGRYRAMVYTNREYAPHLKFGTTRMAARPFLGPAASAEANEFRARVAAILRNLR